ncbi:MAG: UDP-glucose 4-epimerase GalE [Paracoccaceae bacterium]
MNNVLVTGGAGFIGSHACKVLKAEGYTPVTYDNLSTGWQDAVKFGPFVQGELDDRENLDAAFAEFKPVAVLHFAASSQVGESIENPGMYWRNNVLGSLTLVEAAIAAGCLDFVFSSTCATYGDQDNVILDENSAQLPPNSYASSKRAIEEILRDFHQSHGLRHVIFRYFNVAGADPDGEVGEFHKPETHLIPMVLDVIDGKRPALTINGDDYGTADGTCVRDYVHVIDLVDAHVLGLKWLQSGKENRVFNLGSGLGFSVREVMDKASVVTNRPLDWNIGPRRPGDCAKLVSGSTRAKAELGWKPALSTLDQMIKDAWRWHQNGNYDQ